MQKWSRHTCVRPYVTHILHLITTSLYRYTCTIFVRIWSRRCIISHLNGHTLSCILHLTILVATKRGCLRTDVINFGTTEKNSQLQRNNNRNKNNNPRLFQAFKFFFFRLHFRVRSLRLSFLLLLTLSQFFFVLKLLCLVRLNICLCRPKKHFLTIHEFIFFFFILKKICFIYDGFAQCLAWE